MIEILRYTFILLCLSILGWGIIRVERIYQFPTFMASIFVMFIWPQINSLISAPDGVTEEMIERIIIMSCLCVAMCWIGYCSSPNRQLLQRLNTTLDEDKLTQAASALTVLGLFSFYLTGQVARTLQAGVQWTGRATIFAFFTQLSTLGFAIFLMLLLRRFTLVRLTGTVIAGSPLWQSIFQGGRRQATVTFIIIIGMTLWFVKRWAPPRLIIIPATYLGIYVIPLYGQLRGKFWTLLLARDWETLNETSDQMMQTMDRGGILELRNAAFAMDYASRFGQYEYGADYWNGFVFQYVPGQLLGYDFKASLMLPTTGFSSLNYYNYEFPLGTTWTGIGDTYLQFGFFGCLIFGLMAMLFKNLWVSANTYNSQVAFLLMANLASPAMVSVSHGTVRFVQEAIFNILVVALVFQFCKTKKFNKQRFSDDFFTNK
ncbi:hypothetical protein H6G45_13345 [Synechocystis sp. FACHB-383]|uniref:hypothetical protein n=1 Tax=Synechocystis sp. FACHB-383 TaxID=2692864 RepID=UPI0016892DEB|nr:hypothetical protein [Synechocystis sp. FACHB-383]MBD2654449.1 hypothetical protein [Synechocystis sp. FACHB-383]